MKLIQSSLTLALLIACAAASSVAQAQDAVMRDLMQRGQELVASEEYDKAAEQFQKCVDLDDEFPQAWFMLGYALHMDRQLDKAIVAHQKAADLDNSQIKAIATYNLACAHTLLGDSNLGIEKLKECIELGYDDYFAILDDSDLFALHTNPQFAVIMAELDGQEETVEKLNEAQEYIDNQNFDKAAAIYQSIVDKYPDNDFACYRLGFALHGAGKLDEAIKFHKQATEFPATAGIGHYNWGCALSLQGETEEAVQQLQKAVDHGFVRLVAYENDPDLDSLRDDSRFQELLGQVRGLNEAKVKMIESKEDEDDNAKDEPAPPAAPDIDG